MGFAGGILWGVIGYMSTIVDACTSGGGQAGVEMGDLL